MTNDKKILKAIQISAITLCVLQVIVYLLTYDVYKNHRNFGLELYYYSSFIIPILQVFTLICALMLRGNWKAYLLLLPITLFFSFYTLITILGEYYAGKL